MAVLTLLATIYYDHQSASATKRQADAAEELARPRLEFLPDSCIYSWNEVLIKGRMVNRGSIPGVVVNASVQVPFRVSGQPLELPIEEFKDRIVLQDSPLEFSLRSPRRVIHPADNGHHLNDLVLFAPEEFVFRIEYRSESRGKQPYVDERRYPGLVWK